MARTPNPALATTLLAAARAIWLDLGEPGLNLRTLAARAGTTTATLYTRFRDRDDILRALRDDCLERFHSTMRQVFPVEVFCAAYLDYAEQNPRDYAMIFGPSWRDRSSPADIQQLLDRLIARVDAELHCGPERARRTALQLWVVLHGAASERLNGPPGPLWPEIRSACLSACRLLLRHHAEDNHPLPASPS